MQKRSIKIATKQMLLNIAVVATAVVTVTTLCLVEFHKELSRVANISQETRIKTFWELLSQKGKEFRLSGDKLMAGNYVMNNNFELPDRLSELTGGTATVFMKDVRVSTNVTKSDGSRAVGTKLQGPAYDAIFKEGHSYRGEAPILGEPYFTAYDPIRNSQGEIIGVLYVGIKKAEFFASYNKLKTGIITVSVIMIVMSSLIVLWAVRRHLKPLLGAVNVTEKVAGGNLNVDMKAAGKRRQINSWRHCRI